MLDSRDKVHSYFRLLVPGVVKAIVIEFAKSGDLVSILAHCGDGQIGHTQLGEIIGLPSPYAGGKWADGRFMGEGFNYNTGQLLALRDKWSGKAYESFLKAWEITCARQYE